MMQWESTVQSPDRIKAGQSLFLGEEHCALRARGVRAGKLLPSHRISAPLCVSWDAAKLAQLEKSVEQEMALNVELQQRQTEQEKLLAQRDDVSSQLQEVNRANSRLLEQLTELGQEKDKLQQELEETRKTADKRKAMLDELAIDVAQEKSRHKEELSDARLQHEKEVLGGRARYEKELRGLHEDKNRTEEEIRSQLRNEKARTRELESIQQTVEKLQAQIQSMEGTKGWFERRLKEADETAEKSALEHQEQIVIINNSMCSCTDTVLGGADNM
ncbi:hypothetical protein AAFF_G00001720 [Aldrovandia affinis]|uniref:Uncharacterized protein n=1 Tax=Aldrovandia affinis TaxID=143900 RepID=A0AAD7TDB3_9TELE|nr:hypothetical protein AAFF_G00001720 [Aldrovandia affinis]